MAALPPAISLLSLDAITQQAITVQSARCSYIDLYENDQAGTTDYLVRLGTDPASSQATKPAGQKWTISASTNPNTRQPGIFLAGQVVGYIILATGSATFIQEEY